MLQLLLPAHVDLIESTNEVLLKNPHAFSEDDPDANEVGDYLLPFSTGFEIECMRKDTFSHRVFTNIPNIMSVNIDKDEQRFRIPSGLTGLRCLSDISQALKRNSELDPRSGVHYHIDCTDMYHKITPELVEANKEWILAELDSWGYKGTYNGRDMSWTRDWVRVHQHCKTLEFRIGEMTFDYEVLCKRILHCNEIVRKFKAIVELAHLKLHDPLAAYRGEDMKEILTSRIEMI